MKLIVMPSPWLKITKLKEEEKISDLSFEERGIWHALTAWQAGTGMGIPDNANIVAHLINANNEMIPVIKQVLTAKFSLSADNAYYYEPDTIALMQERDEVREGNRYNARKPRK